MNRLQKRDVMDLIGSMIGYEMDWISRILAPVREQQSGKTWMFLGFERYDESQRFTRLGPPEKGQSPDSCAAWFSSSKLFSSLAMEHYSICG